MFRILRLLFFKSLKIIFQTLCLVYYFGLVSCYCYIHCSHGFYSLTFPFEPEENFGTFFMDQSICTVYIKEMFQVILFATCGSLKDSLSISASLITIQQSE